MRYLLIIFVLLILVVGCSNTSNLETVSVLKATIDDAVTELDESDISNESESNEPRTPTSTDSTPTNLDFVAYIDFPMGVIMDVQTFMDDPTVDPDVPSHAQQRENLGSWLDHFKERGVTIIALYMSNFDGEMFYPSTVLGSLGYDMELEYPDLLAMTLEEAKKRDLKVSVISEDLAHIYYGTKEFASKIKDDAITPQLLSAYVDELGQYQKQYGVQILINEEVYGDKFIAALEESTNRNNIIYTHYFDEEKGRTDMFISEDYTVYPFNAFSNQKDKESLVDLAKMGTAASTFGDLNIMFGHANTIGKKTGCLTSAGWGLVKHAQQNVCLMRAIQFAPEYYGFVPASYDDKEDDPEELTFVFNYDYAKLIDLISKYGKKSTDSEKPKANLIIVNNEDYQDNIDSVISVASSAILAAGYDLHVTYDLPLGEMDLYYVVAPAPFDEWNIDLPNGLTGLNADKVFYHPIGAPTSDNWKSIMDDVEADFKEILYSEDESPLPEQITYTFASGPKKVYYQGYTIWPENVKQAGTLHDEHFINIIRADNELAQADADSRTAVLFEKDNVYVVNGAPLHLDFASVLANQMNEVYNTNSYGYLTTGKERSTFFAAEDTFLDVNLPGGSKVVEFDKNGDKITTSVSLINGRLSGNVKKWHLVVVV